MKLMGFNFRKINVEKMSDSLKDLKINTKIDIAEINKVKADFYQGKEEMMGIRFSYEVDYAPNIAKIEFEGTILLGVEPKIAKEVLKQWENKNMPEDFRIPLFNIILKKSNLKAMQLEEELNLPLHVPLPSLRKEDLQEKKQ